VSDKKIIQKIEVNLSVIRNLFDRVLDISRIDSGAITPRTQQVTLQTQFDKLDAQFGELAASRGLWLRFVPTEARVMHDPELMDRMVSNLIHNAIKYTRQGGVWVAWRAARGQLEVRDSGQGIAPADQQNIFNEFAQLGNPGRNNDQGLGLGLSIVRRLADMTQTPLDADLSLDAGATTPIVTRPSPEPATPPTQTLLGLHLLYAEDEPQLLELFTAVLSQAGAIVYPCASVAQALAVVRSEVPLHAVLTDYRLGTGGGTGLDLVHAARNRNQQASGSDPRGAVPSFILPAVILTGDTAVKDLQAMQQITHITLLHKPVNLQQLVVTLRTAID
jgi:two-component system, sensor histidine kinase